MLQHEYHYHPITTPFSCLHGVFSHIIVIVLSYIAKVQVTNSI